MTNTRHIIPISGKDSLATAIAQRTHEPDLPYEFIFNDTRMELPETYEWLETVEKALGVSIVRTGRNLEQVILEEKILPSAQIRFCTKLAKIFPMRDYIGDSEAVLYIGLRADEDRVGYAETRKISVRYPLKEIGITLPMVYRIVEKQDLMPPNFFWDRVFNSVRSEMGKDLSVIEELPRYVFDRAFAWRSRPNCFMCFYQRRYEWAGLLEHHPELFDKAEQMESEGWLPTSTREQAYYWISEDMPLKRIRERFDELVQSRVNALCRMLRKRLQRELWSDSLFDEMEVAQKSCGLFCGK